MPDYELLRPREEIRIGGLYSLHYFQFASGYVFSGEKHDFWELVYIDQGEAEIGAGREVRQLYQGQAIFHRPNEFHTIWANYKKGAGIFVISFACRSPAMRAFRGLQCTLPPAQRQLLAQLIAEGQRVFGPVLDISQQKQLRPLPSAPPGGAQMIVLVLTQLLLTLLRDIRPAPLRVSLPRVSGEQDFAPVFEHAREQMCAAPDGTLRFTQVCRAAGLSATAFKERFKRYTGVAVMDYYRRLRIEEARKRLRAGDKNIAQIADELGYSSAAAFSRQFKRIMRLTPSEYLRSIRL